MRGQHARLKELYENIPSNLSGRCHREILALDGHEVFDGNSGMARDLPHDPATKIIDDVLTARHENTASSSVMLSRIAPVRQRRWIPKSHPVGAPAPRSNSNAIFFALTMIMAFCRPVTVSPSGAAKPTSPVLNQPSAAKLA